MKWRNLFPFLTNLDIDNYFEEKNLTMCAKKSNECFPYIFFNQDDITCKGEINWAEKEGGILLF